MKKYFSLAVAASFSVLAVAPASAALNLFTADGFGDPSAVTLSPGNTFTFTLGVTSTQELIIGVGYSFQLTGPTGSVFTLLGRSLIDTLFTDETTPDGTLLAPAAAVLDPELGDPGLPLDLGALTEDLSSVGVGSFEVADYTFLIPVGARPGIYTISTTVNVAANTAFEAVPVTPTFYTVTVVPEPTTFGLLAVGGLALAARRRRG